MDLEPLKLLSLHSAEDWRCGRLIGYRLTACDIQTPDYKPLSRYAAWCLAVFQLLGRHVMCLVTKLALGN